MRLEAAERGNELGGEVGMSRKIWILSALLMSASSISFAAGNGEYQPGEVIVKYKEQAIRTRSLMNQIYDAAGVRKIRRFSGLMRGVEHLVLSENVKVEDAIAELQRN